MKRKMRHGIGWTSRVGLCPGYCSTHMSPYDFPETAKSFQKIPEVKRAAKKAERLADFKMEKQ